MKKRDNKITGIVAISRRWLLVGFLALASCGGDDDNGASSGGGGTGGGGDTDTSALVETYKNEIFAGINTYRNSQGLSALIRDESIDAIAEPQP